MLKGVYAKTSEMTIEEQVKKLFGLLDGFKGYGMKVLTLKNVSLGESACNIPVLVVRHPKDYLYIYRCDGHNCGKVDLQTTPSGIIKRDESYKVAGPMFKENWIAEPEEDGFTDVNLSLGAFASYILEGETKYSLKN